MAMPLAGAARQGGAFCGEGDNPCCLRRVVVPQSLERPRRDNSGASGFQRPDGLSDVGHRLKIRWCDTGVPCGGMIQKIQMKALTSANSTVTDMAV